MQGQVGALTRVGVTFTEAQEKALKYGNEQERAAVLAQVITDNVGNMNAVMANTPQGQLQQIANTWGDIKEVVGAKLYPAVMQFFNIINANMPVIENAVMGFAGALEVIIQGLSYLVEAVGEVGTFVQDNWATIQPIMIGAAFGIAAAALAWGIYSLATSLANGETLKLFTRLLSSPFLWIAIVVGIVVAAIYRWVQAVGGIRIAWLICVNAVSTQLDKLKLGFMTTGMNIQNTIDNMAYGFASFKAGVLNVLGNLRAQGLMILQDFINSAISMVNQLINTVNAITGAGIDTINWTAEFGSKAVMEEAENRQQRRNDLTNMKSQNDAAAKERLWNQMRMQGEMDAAKAERDAEISRLQRESAAAKAEKNEAMYGGGAAGGIKDSLANTAGNTGNTAANTAAMADAMDIIDEDLKYMRDAAEQEIINRFTLAELKLDINNNNTLTKKVDLDDFGRMMNDTLAEFLASAAEGGHF